MSNFFELWSSAFEIEKTKIESEVIPKPNKSKTKFVVRIEHEDGYGCFNNAGTIETKKTIYEIFGAEEMRERFNARLLPTPYGEGLSIGADDKEWFCAFKNHKQIHQFFNKSEIETLKNHNYKILKLRVAEYQAGKVQVIFTKESIKKKIDITEKLLK
jgi:hypothetical protein